MWRAVILMASVAFAQDLSQDTTWAQRTGLQPSDVAAMRKFAGIPDRSFGQAILSLDAQSLKSRNQVLMTEAGGGHCMRVHVFARARAGWKEVWALTDGICSKAPVSPRVNVTLDGKIVIEVPVMADPFIRTIPVDTYTYAWKRSTYQLEK
jgi:hypothetical protein